MENIPKSDAEPIYRRGRIVFTHHDCYELDDELERICFRWHESLNVGEIVEIEGVWENARFTVKKVVVLVVPIANTSRKSSDWRVFLADSMAKRKNMVLRANVLKAIRAFFDEKGFIEIETPYLNQGCGQDPNINLFRTQYQDEKEKPTPCWLMPSPEHHMKRLLGSGFTRIYQVGRAFRNGERTDHHNPEFTMLEWYRAYHDYNQIMIDLENLVSFVVNRVKGTSEIDFQGQALNLQPPWRRISVRAAMDLWGGVKLERCPDRISFYKEALSLGYKSIQRQDTWEDIFFKIFIEKVEPQLKKNGPVLIFDYPASMASLARLKEGDKRWAERVEGYICGLELANGYSELNDSLEQRQRFLAEKDSRDSAGKEDLPIDEDFLKMMAEGMPPATGMALGVDRLVMLCANTSNIDDVIAFPLNV